MKALRSTLPLLALMLLWAVCSVSQVQAEVKTVKLCGREFIRAVVYTCGGSRWRRLLTPQNMEDSLTQHVISVVSKSLQDQHTEEKRTALESGPCKNDGILNGEQNSAEDLSESESLDLSTRDINHLMTNMCCQVGCQKRDLTYLC